jgi:hypothetical protein
MKKGANNAETMDSQFKDWLYDHFSFLSGKHVGEVAATKIQAEVDADGGVTKVYGYVGSLEDSQKFDKVHGIMNGIYKNLPIDMYIAHVKAKGAEQNKEVGKLVMQLPARMHLAYTQSFSWNRLSDAAGVESMKNGNTPDSFMGIDIVLNPNLADERVRVGALNNFVTVVDDLADVKGIQAKYYEELSSDYLWGQFSIGFSYKISEEIYEYILQPL